MASRLRVLLYLAITALALALLRTMYAGRTESTSYLPSRHSHQQPYASAKTYFGSTPRASGLRYGYAPGPFPNTSLHCRSRICAEFLTDPGLDVPHFRYCWKKSQLAREPPLSVCRFVDGSRRSPVGLAGFPGSGNTWVRGLLQKVTGLCTGGIYCDVTLRPNGFPGECIRSGAVLAVKTHQADPRWTRVAYDRSAPFTYFHKVEHIPVYSSGLLLIRNPYHALVSEWNREMTVNFTDNHVNRVGVEYFRANEQWDRYVHSEATVWKDTVLAWTVHSHAHPVTVFQYETLVTHTEEGLRSMLEFLRVPYDEASLKMAVGEGYAAFKRQHQDTFDPFTEEQQGIVNAVVAETMVVLLASDTFSAVADFLVSYIRE